MRIQRGYAGGLYVVFPTEYEASKWAWLFSGILRRPWACFGNFDNAFELVRASRGNE